MSEITQKGTQTIKKVIRGLANIPEATNSLPQIQGRFSPGPILVITIGGIALAEIIAMAFVFYARDWPYGWQVLLDASIMTIIIFPILYFLSFRPLVQYIQHHNQSETILRSRLHLMTYANTHTLDELLRSTLDEAEALTGSKIGFFHFLEADQKTLWLQAWSTNTLQNMCTAAGKDSHYGVEKAGVWADAVRQRKPILHNDYASLSDRKGLPEGHAPVVRELVIPILRDKKVVAILGVGNKEQDYTPTDMQLLSSLSDFAWDIVENKRVETSLRQSEGKFRTLADWTFDWELWLDPQDNIIYTSPSCERITGYKAEELTADPIMLVQMVHPDERPGYEEHRKKSHDTASDTTTQLEFRILSREGNEYWIEHICRPLYGPDGQLLGRRISNRDITERKQAESKIAEQNQREEKLTQALQTIQLDIARDLHDTLGQNIGYLRMNLEHLGQNNRWSNPDSIQPQLKNMTKVADESYDLIRAMLSMLQLGFSTEPLDLFSRYGIQVAERASFKFEINSRGKPNPLFPDQVRQIFYIFREALNNIEKYAGADQVACEFIWDDHALTFEISDNGRGFDTNAAPVPGHYGLNFMRTRVDLLNGSFAVHSEPGEGTTLTVVVPNEYEPVLQSQTG